MAVLVGRLVERHLGSLLSAELLSVQFNAPVQQLKPGLVLPCPGRGDQTGLRLRCGGRRHGEVPSSPTNTSSVRVIHPLSGLA